MLGRVTTARTHTVSDYDTPHDGHAREDYFGEVSVDRRTFEQKAHAVTVQEVSWPGITIEARSVMDLTFSASGVDVAIDTWVSRNGDEVSHRTWRETVPRPWS